MYTGIALGVGVGVVVMAVLVWKLMPGMMIKVRRSALGFDQTVEQLQQKMEETGWNSPGVLDMQQSLAKHGQPFERRVKIIQLCQPAYAKSVLTTDRWVSCLMPCAIAVWEDDGGDVWVSKMNTGLMGKLFGGNIAKVMGGQVAKDEQAILAGIHA
jgi:uncharacterized protein (DUF302 family)